MIPILSLCVGIEISLENRKSAQVPRHIRCLTAEYRKKIPFGKEKLEALMDLPPCIVNGSPSPL